MSRMADLVVGVGASIAIVLIFVVFVGGTIFLMVTSTRMESERVERRNQEDTEEFWEGYERAGYGRSSSSTTTVTIP